MLAVVVVVGLASAQLRSEVTPPVAVVPIVTVASTTDAQPSPPASREVSPRLRAGELAEAVRSGSLEQHAGVCRRDAGRRLRRGLPPCADPTLAVEGLALDVVPGTLGTAVGIPLPGSVLVLEVHGSGLVYRGALIVQSNGTPRYEVLAGGSAARPPDPSALTDVAGWLMLDGPCTSPPSAFLPCPRLSMLADKQPKPTGHRRADAGPAVAVPLGAWGIDDAGSSIVEGPFLVRPTRPRATTTPAWEIVARYDPSRSVRVVIP